MIEKVTTEDGSTTYFNEKYKQCYHSKVGAYTEALEKHVIPSGILELTKNQEEIFILDVCFGLGYNSGVAIEKILEINPNCKINIIGLENDRDILKEISTMDVPDRYKEINNEISKLTKNIEKDYINYEASFRANHGSESARKDNNHNLKIHIYIGDARKTILEIAEEKIFDAVFFDPFSPKECPELWTEDFIKEVVKRTKTGAKITTYSSARVVKDNFRKAGCGIKEGPKVGKRSGGVIAAVKA